jgi:hypothetical protein
MDIISLCQPTATGRGLRYAFAGRYGDYFSTRDTASRNQPTAACTILKQIVRINEELIGQKNTTEAYYRYENKKIHDKRQ